LFEGIDGTGVFLGVGEAAVPEVAGYGLDVGSVAEEVGSTTVTGAVPSYMFLDAGASHPLAQGFQAHGMRRQWEDDLIAVAVFGLTNKVQESVIEGNDNTAGCAMGLGLALLKLQQFVRVVDVGIGEVFYIAPAETAVETEDKGTVNVGILLFIMRPPYPIPNYQILFQTTSQLLAFR